MATKKSLWNTEIMGQALLDSVRKLDPRGMVKNPVMFVVEVGSVLTTVLLIDNTVNHRAGFGFGRQSGKQEERAALAGNLPSEHRAVHRAAGQRDPHSERPNLLPGTEPGPHPGTFAAPGWTAFLTITASGQGETDCHA